MNGFILFRKSVLKLDWKERRREKVKDYDFFVTFLGGGWTLSYVDLMMEFVNIWVLNEKAMISQLRTKHYTRCKSTNCSPLKFGGKLNVEYIQQ